MRDLDSVFEEALLDGHTGVLDNKGVEARILLGIKIVRDRESGEVEILNTSKGGDYYQEISSKEYDVFKQKTWRHGVYVVYLSNCRLKLNFIEANISGHIKDSANKKNPNSKERIEELQARRLSILKKYTEITNKLNQLHNE
tara:strand:+ start:1628 stop:2053 length:426 start_codon:yes stop_codon:yes gene_type:complete